VSEKKESLKRLLRFIYSDIIRGYSYCRKFDCYIKHLDDEKFAVIGEKEEDAKLFSEQHGLPNEKRKIEELISHGVWSPQEESEIVALEKEIKNSHAHMAALKSVTVRETETKRIEENTKKVEKLRYRRSDLLGLTVEKFMTRKRSDITVYHSFYKDKDCEIPLWTEEEYDELDQSELGNFILEFNITYDRFDRKNIQRLAAQPYFLNKFFIAGGDPVVFMGKTAIELTQFQADLLSQGRTFKSILEHNEKGESPPEAFYEDPDKLATWYLSQIKDKNSKDSVLDKQLSSSQSESSLTATTHVDADVEDMKAEAISKGQQPVDLAAEIARKQEETGRKELDLIDILQIHGEDTTGLSR